ncbi:MAG: PLP-dependent aminotransferase family protein [Myxococcota bacterium]
MASLIRHAIESKRLLPGDRIPASRTLARELGLARGTVVTALEIVIAEGLLETRRGSGTFVSSEAPIGGTPEVATQHTPSPVWVPVPAVDSAPNDAIDFRPCRPSMDGFPLVEWRRSLASAANQPPDSDYGDPRGDRYLREQILSYLRRSRGLTPTIDEIIVTNGAVHAMSLLASLYLSPSSSVVFENPGYPLARQTFALSGARLHLCDVDDDGIRCDQLPSRKVRPRLVYVTPSHQFPLGSRLSLARRRALIDWAHENGTLIVEDDYDGEFRYDVPPLAPMAAMAPNTVVYCGTFSKTMFPGLRLGFAIAPRSLIDAMAARRAICEYAPAAPTQLALATFIESGHYERHVYRMRRRYAKRRAAVSDFIKHVDAPASLRGLDSGLSVCIELRQGLSARSISEAAARRGVCLPTLDAYRVGATGDDTGLVCGYAEPRVEDIARGLELAFGQTR